MAYQLLVQLHEAVFNDPPDEQTILRRFINVTDVGNDTINYYAVHLALRNLSINTPFALYNHIDHIIPHDNLYDERVNILGRLPMVCLKNSDFRHLVVTQVANIIMERNVDQYENHKAKLGDLLLSIPSAPTDDETNELIFEEDRIQILHYIELYLNPLFDTTSMDVCNHAYATMAKKVGKKNFPMFWETTMLSVYYSYHNLMAALTYRLYDRSLSTKEALQFMKEKSVNEILMGITECTSKLKEAIEKNFLMALVRTSSNNDLEHVLLFLKNNKLVSEVRMEKVMKKYLQELRTINVSPRDNAKSLEILVRQTILTKQRCCHEERKDVLKSLMNLEPFTEEMNELEQRMFYAILACTSYPKHCCDEAGNMGLYRKLITRMFGLLPEYKNNNVRIAFNDYENVMFCIHSLFDIEVPHQMVLHEIEPLWRAKVLHALDLHVITSGNLAYFRHHQEDPLIERKMRREMDVITNLGQLLVFLFGVLNSRALPVELHYNSPYEHFKDEEFVKCFTTETFMDLSTMQTAPGERIKLPHRIAFTEVDKNWELKVFEYNARLNGTWVSDDSDDSNDSDYSHDSDDTDQSEYSDDNRNLNQMGRSVESDDSDSSDDSDDSDDDSDGEMEHVSVHYDPNDGSDEASDDSDDSDDESDGDSEHDDDEVNNEIAPVSVEQMPVQQAELVTMESMEVDGSLGEEEEHDGSSDSEVDYSEYTLASQSSDANPYSSDEDEERQFSIELFHRMARNIGRFMNPVNKSLLEGYLDVRFACHQTRLSADTDNLNEEMIVESIREYGSPDSIRPWRD